jgi:hypothetical protein
MMKDYNEKLKTKESKESKDAKPEVKAATPAQPSKTVGWAPRAHA